MKRERCVRITYKPDSSHTLTDFLDVVILKDPKLYQNQWKVIIHLIIENTSYCKNFYRTREELKYPPYTYYMIKIEVLVTIIYN